MQRIAIFGGPGSGKSTLARRLGAELDLEVVHLDALNFAPVAPHLPITVLNGDREIDAFVTACR